VLGKCAATWGLLFSRPIGQRSSLSAKGSRMTPFTFSRFAYFDTNIISNLAKNQSLRDSLSAFLVEHDLTLGLSTAQVVELADARKLHTSLVALFLSVPTALLKTWDAVIAEEVEAHPRRRTQSLLMYPVNAMLLEDGGIGRLYGLLSSEPLAKARRGQLLYAQQMEARLTRLKNNFPPSKSGKYVRKQSDKFADYQVMQWLVEDHRGFIEAMQADISSFHPEVFLSIRLFAHVLFYKYYLGNREPKKLSDFGDLFHLFYIPYCELAVMERDLCNVLNQIKRNHDILENTSVKNIDFLSQWDWP
jgi:hypothetical protein